MGQLLLAQGLRGDGSYRRDGRCVGYVEASGTALDGGCGCRDMAEGAGIGDDGMEGRSCLREGDGSGLDAAGVELRRDGGGLSLVGDGMVLRADFPRLLARTVPDRIGHELLVRAARVRGVESPVAIDATAGLGEDSFLLAAAGFTVELYEHDPVVAALLRDGLERAMEDPDTAQIASRMHLHESDSIAALSAPEHLPDVVYLDPMFPERRKSSAVKKKSQLLQRLEGPCTDEDASALVEAAIAARPRKVVVKRPPKGPYLAGIEPAYSIEGKSVRFDCLLPSSMPAERAGRASSC